MNAKKFKIFSCIISCLIVICSTSCISTKITDPELIESNSRAIGKLEATADSIDRILDDSTERIGAISERSQEITDGIERLEYLFDQYESESNRIINELIEERDRIRAYIKDYVDVDLDKSDYDRIENIGNDW